MSVETEADHHIDMARYAIRDAVKELTPVPVPATAGKVPCGAFLNWPDGEREEHLCDHCRNEIDQSITQGDVT